MSYAEPLLLVRDKFAIHTAVGFDDGSVKVIVRTPDSSENTLVHSHVGYVSAICITSNDHSAFLATGGVDGKAFIYRNELNCWHRIFCKHFPSEITSVAFSPNADYFVVSSIGHNEIYKCSDKGDYELKQDLEYEGRCRCCFSDNDLIIVDGSGQMRIYKLDDEKAILYSSIRIAMHEVQSVVASAEKIAIVDRYYSEKQDIVRIFDRKTKKLYEIWPKKESDKKKETGSREDIDAILGIAWETPTMELVIYSDKEHTAETLKLLEDRYHETHDSTWVKSNP